MFSSGIKVQNYRKLLQMTETSPSGLRNEALGLDLRVQRKLFESSPAQTLVGEMMTSPPLHPERDDSLCTGVVLPKAT